MLAPSIEHAFSVTVAAKNHDHPFFEKGSDFGYVVDGQPGQTIHLLRGKTYRFNIDAIGHPFMLSTGSEGANGEDNTSLMLSARPTDNGIITFTVPTNFPDNYYYVCIRHPFMGGRGTATTPIDGHNGTINSLTVRVEDKWTGFVSLTDMTYVPGDPDRVFLADQIGLVYRIDTTTGNRDIFLDVRSYVPPLNPAYDERGLLGLAFHPQFNISDSPNAGRFFIFYSSKASRFHQQQSGVDYYNCLSEFRWTGSRVLMENEVIMIRIARNRGIHSGGKIVIDAQNMLYLSIGDGGPQKDPDNNGQRLDTLEGKILRLDVSQPGSYPNHYRIPTDNPFVNLEGAKPEIYAYGFRNVWGLTLANINGFTQLISTDAGYNDREEINVIIPGGNYGWNVKEGTMITGWGSGQPTTDMIDPVYEYQTHQFPELNFQPESSVIIGGHWLDGIGYVFGDYSGVIMVVRPGINPNRWERVVTTKYSKRIKSFGRDTQGRVYILGSEREGPNGQTSSASLVTIS